MKFYHKSRTNSQKSVDFETGLALESKPLGHLSFLK